MYITVEEIEGKPRSDSGCLRALFPQSELFIKLLIPPVFALVDISPSALV